MPYKYCSIIPLYLQLGLLDVSKSMSQSPCIDKFTLYCGNLVAVRLLIELLLTQLVLKLQLYQRIPILGGQLAMTWKNSRSASFSKTAPFHNIRSTCPRYLYTKTNTCNIHDYATRDNVMHTTTMTNNKTNHEVCRVAVVAQVTIGFEPGWF